jgi:hypothetical protein
VTAPREPHVPPVVRDSGPVPQSPLLHPEGRPTARKVGDDERHRHGLGWLPWVLAALIGLVLLGILLAALNAGGDDTASTGSGTTSSQSGTDAGTDAGAGQGGAAAAGAGTLVAGGQDLLADGGAGLAQYVGQPAEGAAVRVESVVADEGFWVGSSPQQRVFVFLSESARQSAGESGFQVEAGQTVQLSGEVSPLEGQPSELGVEDAEGADQLRTQAAYITAETVSLSS